MKTLKIPTHLSIHLDYELVSWGARMGGFLLDWFTKWMYILILNITILSKWDAPIFVTILLYLPFSLYSFLFEWFNSGQSLGKMMIKARVISADGQPASIYQILTRWFFNMIDVFGVILLSILNESFYGLMIISPFIGGFILIFSKKNQRLGDMAANTIVVSTRETFIGLDQTVYKYANQAADYTPTYPEIMKLSDRDMSKIQQLMEKGDFMQNENLIHKLAIHVQNILKIETDQSDIIFLNTILSDYNYYAKLDSANFS